MINNIDQILNELNIDKNKGYFVNVGNIKIKSIYEQHNCNSPLSNKIINRYYLPSLFDEQLSSYSKTSYSFKEAMFNFPLHCLPIEVRLYLQFSVLSNTYILLQGYFNYLSSSELKKLKFSYDNVLKILNPLLCSCETLNDCIIMCIKYAHSLETIGKSHITFLCNTDVHTYANLKLANENFLPIVEDLEKYTKNEQIINFVKELYSSRMFSSYNSSLLYYYSSFYEIYNFIRDFKKILNTKKKAPYAIRYSMFNPLVPYNNHANFIYYLKYIDYKESSNKLSSLIRKPKISEYSSDKKIMFVDEYGKNFRLTKKEVDFLITKNGEFHGTFIINP